MCLYVSCNTSCCADPAIHPALVPMLYRAAAVCAKWHERRDLLVVLYESHSRFMRRVGVTPGAPGTRAGVHNFRNLMRTVFYPRALCWESDSDDRINDRMTMSLLLYVYSSVALMIYYCDCCVLRYYYVLHADSRVVLTTEAHSVHSTQSSLVTAYLKR